MTPPARTAAAREYAVLPAPDPLSPVTVEDLLGRLRSLLPEQHETSSFEAQLILSHLLGRPRTWLLAHPEAAIAERPVRAALELAARRAAGTPLPYLLGEWEFYGLRLMVNPAVLIPRPETELLVDAALERLSGRSASGTVVDVGAGSGCIAIAIALHAPKAKVYGLEISQTALETAIQNGYRHNITNITWIESDLLEGLPTAAAPVNIFCANLPYIPTASLVDLAVAAHEPLQALDGGKDGLALIGRLLAQAWPLLAPDGRILLEIEAGQGETVVELVRVLLPEATVAVHPDLAGLPRMAVIGRNWSH